MQQFIQDLIIAVKVMALITTLTVLVATYLYLSKLAYIEEDLIEKEYINNVCNGYHPDYKQWDVKCE
jgi:hypothetical protein